MKREIQYRGQTRRYGEKVRVGDGQKLPGIWVYGGIFPGTGDFAIIYGGSEDTRLEKFVVYADTVGQYTGLPDANGTKIFEDDICDFKVFDRNGNDAHYRGVVVYDGSRFRLWRTVESANYGDNDGFDLDWVVSQYNEFAVIGNIHDSPELLKMD